MTSGQSKSVLTSSKQQAAGSTQRDHRSVICLAFSICTVFRQVVNANAAIESERQQWKDLLKVRPLMRQGGARERERERKAEVDTLLRQPISCIFLTTEEFPTRNATCLPPSLYGTVKSERIATSHAIECKISFSFMKNVLTRSSERAHFHLCIFPFARWGNIESNASCKQRQRQQQQVATLRGEKKKPLLALLSGIRCNTSWRKNSVTWSAAGKAPTRHTHTEHTHTQREHHAQPQPSRHAAVHNKSNSYIIIISKVVGSISFPFVCNITQGMQMKTFLFLWITGEIVQTIFKINWEDLGKQTQCIQGTFLSTYLIY